VIIPDVNLLLYAYNRASDEHLVVKKWLEDTFSDPRETLAFPWAVLLSFVRIATNPRLFPKPLSTVEALEILTTLLSRKNACTINPGERHFEILSDLIVRNRLPSSAISDAHLAALAMECGATFASADTDFRRFDGLKLFNPLQRKR
jgi:uncharacterized protein